MILQTLKTAALALGLVLGAAFGAYGLYLSFHVAPMERDLKLSQKIFYLHAPTGIWTIAVLGVAALASIGYLALRRPALDLLCASCIEVGTLGAAVVLTTGAIWAKFAWGQWIPWGEPRVTTWIAVLLVGVSYLVLRSSVDEPDLRARLSSVVALFACASGVLSYLAIWIWNTTHPRVITAEGAKLQADMLDAFLTCIVAMAFVMAFLVAARFRLAVAAHDLEALKLDERLERVAA